MCITDGFGRDLASGWGTSDYGIAWIPATSAGASVTGGAGRLLGGYDEVLYITSTGAQFDASFVMRSIWDTGTANADRKLRVIYANSGHRVDFWFAQGGTLPGQSGFEIRRPGGFVSSLFAVPFASGSDYTVRIVVTASTTNVTVTSGAISYTGSGSQADGSFVPDNIEFAAHTDVGSGYYQEIDDLSIAGVCSPASSGTPVPWTNVGTGNNSRTAWTAAPFRPGSLEVRIDTTPTTPSTQNAVAGTFETSFPPSSVETVWARWVAA
jgi:hypothetical protein